MTRTPKAGAPDPPDPTVQRLLEISDEVQAIADSAEGRSFTGDESRRIHDLDEEFRLLDGTLRPRIAAARLKLRLVGT
jgi:hypothetical protein